MAVNLPKIADTPYLSLYFNSTKQNDNVTMTFPVNSSLQCFRTAALPMVTLNMESRNPMGRVNAENHSKTWKSSGVNGLKRDFMFKVGDWLVSVAEGKFCYRGEILLWRGILFWRQFLLLCLHWEDTPCKKACMCIYPLTGIVLWGNNVKYRLSQSP